MRMVILRFGALHATDTSPCWRLDRGADPNAAPALFATAALQEARVNGHHEMVALLLARGAFDDAA